MVTTSPIPEALEFINNGGRLTPFNAQALYNVSDPDQFFKELRRKDPSIKRRTIHIRGEDVPQVYKAERDGTYNSDWPSRSIRV